MLDFTKDGKRFIAGRGMMHVFDASTGKKIMVAIDVFREKDPTPETVCELYKVFMELTEKK